MTTTKKTRHSRAGFRVSRFAHRLFSKWQRLNLPDSNESVVVGVSGGADSTALLLALAELQKTGRLSLSVMVAHLDHCLRQGSRKDAAWVTRLAEELGFESTCGRAKVRKLAEKSGDNLEQSARNARYEFLLKVANKRRAEIVLTAHTMDDQAETFLLRLMRGSAAEGLSGIEPIRRLTRDSDVKLVRPLLVWARRTETESYCRLRRVDFRVDQMNEDERFARVKVRKQLLPLMQTFNNRVVETLARTANLLREDTIVLSSLARQLLAEASRDQPENNAESRFRLLNINILETAPTALRRRALREWIMRERGDLRRLELVHLIAIEKLLIGTQSGRVVELPDGTRVFRKGRWLELQIKRVEK
jgi:tRNA(Ile)-lysidine synthase